MSKNTVLKKLSRLGCLTLVVVLPLLNLNIANAENRPSIDDEIATSNLRWGGPKLPYGKVANIKDNLVDKVLGTGVIDRHGVGSGVTSPMGVFSSPENAELVFISLWKSTSKGCFVEMVIQHAPKPDKPDFGTAKSMVPVRLELGIGEEKNHVT